MSDTTQSEHRGWEIEDHWNPHPLDDPDFSFTEGAESSGGGFWVLLLLAVVGALLLYVVNLWLSPPRVTFQAPTALYAQTLEAEAESRMLSSGSVIAWDGRHASVAPGWTVTCIAMDAKRKIIAPNYAAPFCRQQFQQHRLTPAP